MKSVPPRGWVATLPMSIAIGQPTRYCVVVLTPWHQVFKSVEVKRARGMIVKLRERGIYRLPNGRELVVLTRHENGHTTYILGGWERFEMSEYEVNEAGRLIHQGKLTAWDLADLKDTGRTAGEYSHPLDKLSHSQAPNP